MRAFTDALARVIESQRIDLVLPTCEEVFFVARAAERLPSACRVFAAPFDLLRLLHSKDTFLAAARAAGVTVPRLPPRRESRRRARVGRRAPGGTEARVLPLRRPRAHPSRRSAAGCTTPRAAGRLGGAAVLPRTRAVLYGIAVDGKLCLNVSYRPTWRLARSSSYYFEPELPARDRRRGRAARGAAAFHGADLVRLDRRQRRAGGHRMQSARGQRTASRARCPRRRRCDREWHRGPFRRRIWRRRA